MKKSDAYKKAAMNVIESFADYKEDDLLFILTMLLSAADLEAYSEGQKEADEG